MINIIPSKTLSLCALNFLLGLGYSFAPKLMRSTDVLTHPPH